MLNDLHSNNSLPQPYVFLQRAFSAYLANLPAAPLLSVEVFNAPSGSFGDRSDAAFNESKEADFSQAPCWYDDLGRAM